MNRLRYRVRQPLCLTLLLSVSVITLSSPLLAVTQPSLTPQEEPSTSFNTTTTSMLWLDEAMPANEVLDINGSTMQLVWPKLNEIQIQAAAVNSARALALLKTEPNACVGNKILSPEREAISYHTQLPQVVFPGLRIFALKNRDGAHALEQFNDGLGVSLAKLLAGERKLRLAVVGGRKYSAEIDDILQNPNWQRQLWRRHGSDDTSGVLRMLQEGRVDFVIEYPNVFNHYQSKLNDTTAYISFPIIESPQTLAGYILCSRTPEGAALIARFDQVLAEITLGQAYLTAHLRWFDAVGQAALLPLYKQEYQTNF